MDKSQKRPMSTLKMTQLAILVAIEAIVCFTPLGSIPAIGPIVATLAHIPVIITAILLGTRAGAFMGFVFGLFSFIVWTFMPPTPPTAFVFTPFYSFGEMQGNFWSVIICFVPRILVGVVASLLFKILSKYCKNDLITYSVSGAAGSLVNTLFVMGGIYFFFGREYANAIGQAYPILLGLIGMSVLTSGVPEAVIAALVGLATKPINKALNRGKKNKNLKAAK